MDRISELVNNINSGTFKPDQINDPNLFLTKHNDLLLIEYVISQPFVNRIHLPEILNHYASLINKTNEFRDVHLLSLTKHIRIVCLYMIQTYSLDDLHAVNTSVDQYFPLTSHSNSDEVISYLHKIKMKETIHFLLTHLSLKIRIGNTAASKKTIQNIHDNIDIITDKLTSMSKHPLYATHTTVAINGLNQVTSQTSALLAQVPVVSFFQRGVQSMASAAGYDEYTQTGRTNKIISFITPLRSLYKCNLQEYNEQKRKSHIEVLFAIYLEADNGLRKHVTRLLDAIIHQHEHDTAFLFSILKIIAPEPLGDMYYGMQKRPANLIGDLTEDSNIRLISACAQYNNTSDFVTVIANIQTPRQHFKLDFDASVNDSTRWLAYLLSMGNLPNVAGVNIHYNNVDYRDQLLLSYLMGSEKLVLSSPSPIHDMVLSPLPLKCMLKITPQNLLLGKITLQTAIFALQHGCSSLRLEIPSDSDTVSQLLNSNDIFANTSAEDAFIYCKIAEQSENIPAIDFMMTRTDIRIKTLAIQNDEATNVLIKHFIRAFSLDEKRLLEKLEKDNDPRSIERPVAIDSSLFENAALLKKITSDPHRKIHWIIIHNKSYEFCFDKTIVRDSSSDTPTLHEGFFSRLGHDKPISSSRVSTRK